MFIFYQAELPVVICDTPERAQRLIDNKDVIPHLKHIIILSPKGELENLRAKAGSDIELMTFDELLVGCFLFLKSTP